MNSYGWHFLDSVVYVCKQLQSNLQQQNLWDKYK